MSVMEALLAVIAAGVGALLLSVIWLARAAVRPQA